MGGFAIQIPESLPESKKFLPSDNSETWFLTEAGIHFLLKEEATGSDKVPDLSEEDIKSKSKANGLAKGLICLQALWFIAQCLTRRKNVSRGLRLNPRYLRRVTVLTDMRSRSAYSHCATRNQHFWPRGVCINNLHYMVGQAV